MRVVEHSGLLKAKEHSKVFSVTFHIPRTNDRHGGRQELDDNEQHIQPRAKQERGGRAQYVNVHLRESRTP